MFFGFEVGVFVELCGCGFDAMVFAVFVGICPVKGFIWFGRTTKCNDHGAVDFLHHFSLCDKEFVLARRRSGQVAKNEGVLSKFGGDEPVETRGCCCRIDVWIHCVRDESVFTHEVLKPLDDREKRGSSTITISNCPPSPIGEESRC